MEERVAQGFLMPVLFGYVDRGATRTTFEHPIDDWAALLHEAGFARVDRRLIPSHLVGAGLDAGGALRRLARFLVREPAPGADGASCARTGQFLARCQGSGAPRAQRLGRSARYASEIDEPAIGAGAARPMLDGAACSEPSEPALPSSSCL
ncbi:hypothetical protein WME73_46380 [Sorangium sp. So ce302]|uniref:hypothetical protein n=1 Tax=Sorangium sp. So ce302 TaxID=3133297 RepID=UPI003F61CA65